ncbi:hypothetical protein [Vogesella indigofera]|uniref:hypothetical protein n=1 Tax=Vogesella indigofera TaxID=45465 RepID=UPI00234FA588|nr:hypothetical protein [Vogesella indigofera]MDC7706777.1 hypothetical protein [Vogesella indigofera]
MKKLLLFAFITPQVFNFANAASIIGGASEVRSALEIDMDPATGNMSKQIYSDYKQSTSPKPVKYVGYFGAYNEVSDGKAVVRITPWPEEIGPFSTLKSTASTGGIKQNRVVLAISGNTFSCIFDKSKLSSLKSMVKYEISMTPLEYADRIKFFGEKTNLLISSCSYRKI